MVVGDDDGPGEVVGPRTGGHRWTEGLVTFVVVFAALLVWSISMPAYAAPDENQHAVKAYALWHREAGHIDPATGDRVFEVPTILSGAPVCFALDQHHTADCQTLASDDATHQTRSTAANYPPFYYLLIGWPTLVSSGEAMLVLLRAASAFWVALLVAVAVHTLARNRSCGAFLPAMLLVLTPIVLFVGATASPSGVAIAAGLATWAGGLALVRDDAPARIGAATARFAIPLCLLILIRRDSVLWAALIMIVLLALSTIDARRALRRSPAAGIWALVVLACALLQLTLSGAEAGSSIAEGGGAGGNALAALGEFPYYAQQMLGGILGWLDTILPSGVYLTYTMLAGFVVLAALIFSARRFAGVLVLILTLVLTTPVLIGSRAFPYFQGRYLLPFAVGLPLVAARGLAESPIGRRWPARTAWVLVPVVVVAQVAAFAQTMQRFTAGAEHAWWFQSTPAWSPALATPTTFVVIDAVVISATLSWLAWVLRTRRVATVPAGRPAPVVPDLTGPVVPDLTATTDPRA